MIQFLAKGNKTKFGHCWFNFFLNFLRSIMIITIIPRLGIFMKLCRFYRKNNSFIGNLPYLRYLTLIETTSSITTEDQFKKLYVFIDRFCRPYDQTIP